MLVNMPLTPANMKLMPKGSYDKYMAMLKRTANQNDVVLLELNDGTKFDIKCFRDTVHMNGTGGKKLMAQIASFINSTSVVDSQTGLKQGLATRLKLEQFDGKLDIAASDASSL